MKFSWFKFGTLLSVLLLITGIGTVSLKVYAANLATDPLTTEAKKNEGTRISGFIQLVNFGSHILLEP